MTTENYYKNIKTIMHITPQRLQRCDPPCNILPKDFSDAVNHFLNAHGFKLLHVGTQSSFSDTGEIVHDVIAVLGK